MPKIVKKRRRIEDESGNNQVTWEEYLDYIYPDEEKEKPVFKLLSMAHAWKQKMEEAKSNEESNKEGTKESDNESDKESDKEKEEEEEDKKIISNDDDDDDNNDSDDSDDE